MQKQEKPMRVATISSKGQITLPAQMRKKLNLEPNDRLILETIDDTIVIKKAPDLFELEGFLGKSIGERKEREIVARAVSRHVKGGRL
jgi:AbrB family looped-hinge helix DNA binding protein